jgi:hypothetical protein
MTEDVMRSMSADVGPLRGTRGRGRAAGASSGLGTIGSEAARKAG